MREQYSIIGSGGELETYVDPYANVTEERIAEAEKLEAEILNHSAQIDLHYLQVGKLLCEFKEKHLYKERGYDSFRAWANSSDLKNIGYRSAHNLMRIVNEALPILAKRQAMEVLPSVSTMVNLLPILSDENAEDKFIEAVYEVKDLTVNDAKERIRDIRGMGRTIDDERPAIFKAQVTRGDDFHSVRIYCSTGADYYEVGVLNIKTRDWPRWAERFSEHFIEYL
jgi:hypothetical protein